MSRVASPSVALSNDADVTLKCVAFDVYIDGSRVDNDDDVNNNLYDGDDDDDDDVHFTHLKQIYDF